jgi:hypothetical protein
MVDLTDCYIVVFTDEAHTVHCVPFAKKEGGNAKANRFLEVVRAIDLTAEKYGPYTRPG